MGGAVERRALGVDWPERLSGLGLGGTQRCIGAG
jgi:hypothetical protein